MRMRLRPGLSKRQGEARLHRVRRGGWRGSGVRSTHRRRAVLSGGGSFILVRYACRVLSCLSILIPTSRRGRWRPRSSPARSHLLWCPHVLCPFMLRSVARTRLRCIVCELIRAFAVAVCYQVPIADVASTLLCDGVHVRPQPDALGHQPRCACLLVNVIPGRVEVPLCVCWRHCAGRVQAVAGASLWLPACSPSATSATASTRRSRFMRFRFS
jgi:hypothetical protein